MLTPDGGDLLLAALTGLLIVVANQLREEPRWVAAALAAIVLLGVGVRLLLSINAPMNAWAFDRILWLTRSMVHGDTLPWVLSVSGSPAVPLVDLISYTNLAAAMLTPLAYFAHARYLLANRNAALAAALIIATLPHHIRFSASDVEFIVSLLSSSLTFIAIYAALIERSRWIALPAVLVAPALSLGTYYTRVENMVFIVVDLAVLALYWRSAVNRWRVIAVGGLTLVAGVFVFVVHVVPLFGTTMQHAVSLETVLRTLQIGLSPRYNTLVNPWIMPSYLPPLAVIGFLVLRRHGNGGKAFFLLGWLLAFFVVESSVGPPSVAMQARYHLHLVTPVVLLAAAAVPELLRRKRTVVLAVVFGWAIASPLLYRGFITDVAYSEMLEAKFVRESLALLPDGCVVLEYAPGSEATQPRMSRIHRLSLMVMESDLRTRVEPLFMTPREDGNGSSESKTLSPVARQALTSSDPGCRAVYFGLTCIAGRDPQREAEAPPCAEARALVRKNAAARLISAADVTAQYYDDPNSGRIVTRPDGSTYVERTVRDGQPLRFELWRVSPEENPPEVEDVGM